MKIVFLLAAFMLTFVSPKVTVVNINENGPNDYVLLDNEPSTRANGVAGCPDKRPEFNSPCLAVTELSCDYGTQTCCGRPLPQVMMTCKWGMWSEFYLETPCMTPGFLCPGEPNDQNAGL
eukprot:TRINITY_DN6816_c0_g1_i2.p1 TRINITY_DN6816_c0_g1~~TRINITY_DN6816_c0_g1_i2.p1  ORF type:complete len:120 (+),score=20.23 TRINITY_DN6816_c0_g1_i2:120-479(+)